MGYAKSTNQPIILQVISAVVGEDRPVYVLQLSRAEAEAAYGQVMYNNRHPVSTKRRAFTMFVGG